jgi:hypothetical protein
LPTAIEPPWSRRPGCLRSSRKSRTPSPRLVYLADVRSERVIIIQVTWSGCPKQPQKLLVSRGDAESVSQTVGSDYSTTKI